ncbi:MAG: TIGR01777 family protein [Desulfobacteraceae bacterium]|nr:TIGR01777 family protein [Desulfobacteraceae bacterium]MBC2755702.1 TIGR01777 family protein [Desulfobacteraceae bacterium]
MKKSIFKKRSEINAPAEEVFKWHARPGAIERLSPPWDPLEIISQTGGIHTGAEVKMKLKAGPIPIKWHARHVEYQENILFQDIQVKGPFSKWIHTHRFEDLDRTKCILEDSIEYALPFHPLGTAVMEPFVEKKLKQIFTYRHNTTIADMAAHQLRKDQGPLNILISGASGLLGSSLIPFLRTGGHHVMQLVRRPPDNEKGEIRWDPANGWIDLDDTDAIDAVIHLSGENIGEGHWTREKKKRIIDSRVQSTRLIAETISQMKNPPRVFLSASAIGFYGDRGDILVDESDMVGNDFISDVCRMWEESTDAAVAAGIRTASLRIGIVLSPQGGALGKLLLPFTLGIGGKISTGRQYMSWISIDDTIGAIHHALFDDKISGPVNLVSPNPVTNKEFTLRLAKVLSRPAYFTVPKFAIETVFGEMGRETILSSTRVKPGVLSETEYSFRHPDLEGALRHLLGKT